MATTIQTQIAAAADSILSTTTPAALPDFSFNSLLRESGHALVTTTPVCPDYLVGHCPRARRCRERHPTPSQSASSGHHGYNRNNDNYVCKHWLKALCKKGDACDYLHEYNLRKMSECQFYNQNGYCQNGDECLYLHVKEESRLPLCEDYNRGFCEKGPNCGKRHVRRKICEFYLVGFCPDGRECKRGVHLKWRADGKGGEEEKDKERRERVEDLERREEENRNQFGRREGGWRGRGGGGRGGKWKNRRDR